MSKFQKLYEVVLHSGAIKRTYSRRELEYLTDQFHGQIDTAEEFDLVPAGLVKRFEEGLEDIDALLAEVRGLEMADDEETLNARDIVAALLKGIEEAGE